MRLLLHSRQHPHSHAWLQINRRGAETQRRRKMPMDRFLSTLCVSASLRLCDSADLAKGKSPRYLDRLVGLCWVAAATGPASPVSRQPFQFLYPFPSPSSPVLHSGVAGGYSPMHLRIKKIEQKRFHPQLISTTPKAPPTPTPQPSKKPSLHLTPTRQIPPQHLARLLHILPEPGDQSFPRLRADFSRALDGFSHIRHRIGDFPLHSRRHQLVHHIPQLRPLRKKRIHPRRNRLHRIHHLKIRFKLHI